MSVRLPVATSEPCPLIDPFELPPATVRVLVDAIVTVPPLSAVTLAVSLKLTMPPLRVPTVEAPLTVVVPLEMVVAFNEFAVMVPPEIVEAVKPPPTFTLAVAEIAEVKLPATLTLPCEIPPVILALLAKVEDPAPERVAAVIVPLPEKFRLPSLVTAPIERLSPVMVAVAYESSERLAFVPPKLTALKVVAFVPPLSVTPEVPANAPEEAVSVPPDIVVAPE